MRSSEWGLNVCKRQGMWPTVLLLWQRGMDRVWQPSGMFSCFDRLKSHNEGETNQSWDFCSYVSYVSWQISKLEIWKIQQGNLLYYVWNLTVHWSLPSSNHLKQNISWKMSPKKKIVSDHWSAHGFCLYSPFHLKCVHYISLFHCHSWNYVRNLTVHWSLPQIISN